MNVVQRHNVHVSGRGTRPMLFAHGFGCDQNMWRFIVPAFEERYKTILFDHVGAGQSDVSAYDREKYGTLNGYATDVSSGARRSISRMWSSSAIQSAQ